jgi:hypothetical protein
VEAAAAAEPFPAEEAVVTIAHGRDTHVGAKGFVEFDAWSIASGEKVKIGRNSHYGLM